MRWLILLISLTVCQNAFSQSNSWSAGTLDIHIVPLALIDGNPRLRLGSEYHPHHRIGYSLEIGVGSSKLNGYRFTNSLWGQDYSFFEIRPEIKWYKKKPGPIEVYYAAEVFYLNMTDKLSHQYYYPEGQPEPISFDEASFSKKKFGLQLKIGTKFLLWKSISLDFYEGLGLAYRNLEYSDVVNPDIYGETICQLWQPSRELEGNYLLAQFSLGFRIGYTIKKW